MNAKRTVYLPNLLLIAAMFIILAILLVFMCLPLGQTTVPAVNGGMDLTGGGMKGRLYRLTGEWQFHDGELIAPEDIRGQTETIEIPSAGADEGHSLNGCATYRLVIRTDDTEQFMLYVPEISSAYSLWVNGEFLRSAGVVSENRAEGRPLFENALLPVRAENGTVELVIQVSNYHFMRSSLTIPLLFGQSDSVLAYFYRTRALYCIALGGILMAAFYHLALYVYRRREKVYLFFSLLCTLCFMRFLVETNGINQFFGWIPMDMSGIRLFMALFFLHGAAIIIFTLFVFDREFLNKYRYWAVAYALPGALLFAFMPLNAPYATVIVTLAIMPFMFFAIYRAARSPVLKQGGGMRLYFAALLIYAVVGYISKYFFDNVLFMTGLLTNMFMIMAQSLVLSKSYARAFEVVEETNENLERIVDERTRELRSTNEAMKELTVNISHDLKTPLTTVILNLEKLTKREREPGMEEYRRCIGIAYDKGLDLQRITQNLFEISRIESGQSLYKPEWISLRVLFPKTQEKYESFLESRGLSFEIKDVAAGHESVEIYADPERIWSVFDNVIYNAARHTKTGGVTVSVEVREENLDIIISDTGEGIANQHLPHIFERFYKVSKARSGGDSGVGLYIVKSIMEGCGGSATARSEAGKGTSIILTFLRGGG